MSELFSRIAATRPSDTNEHVLVSPSPGNSLTGMLSIVNQTGANQTFSLAHLPSVGLASPEDWIFYNRTIRQYDTIEFPALAIGESEALVVKSNVVDGISFNMRGATVDSTIYGRLGALCPDNVSEYSLFTPDPSTQVIGSLTICNITPNPQRFRVAHTGTVGSNALPADWLFYDKEIDPYSTVQKTNINMFFGEEIRVHTPYTSNAISYGFSGVIAS